MGCEGAVWITKSPLSMSWHWLHLSLFCLARSFLPMPFVLQPSFSFSLSESIWWDAFMVILNCTWTFVKNLNILDSEVWTDSPSLESRPNYKPSFWCFSWRSRHQCVCRSLEGLSWRLRLLGLVGGCERLWRGGKLWLTPWPNYKFMQLQSSILKRCGDFSWLGLVRASECFKYTV